MVPIFTRVKARSIEQFGAMIQHPGQEFLFVLEGAIDLYIEPDGPVRMHAGDSYYFDARSAHAAVSVGVGDAIIVSVISQIPQRQ
jgi:quercetin dioxygenase-like cupin family protein